jgi:hypothetical protein
MQAALPLVVGTVTFGLVQLLKQGSAFINSQPALVKRALAVAVAFVVTVLAETVGMPSPCTLAGAEGCLESLTPNAVEGLVGALVAMALHSVAKRPAGA